MISEKCVRCSQGIGWIGLVVNAILMFMKAFIGLVSGSQALVADAMYSAKDLISSVLVLIGMKISDKPLDREHPYGHGKIEFIMALFASVIFLGLTAYLLFHTVSIILYGDEHKAPHIIALFAALISISVNVFMYYYARCVAIESNSPMVRILAKHHYADATASGAVACAIVGAHYLGMPWIDPVVAMFETLHLLYLGSDVFRDAFHGLMDRGVNGDIRARITDLISRTDGVLAVRNFRGRYIGQLLFIEVVIDVSERITVAESSDIVRAAKESILERISHIGSLQIHARPILAEERTAEAGS